MVGEEIVTMVGVTVGVMDGVMDGEDIAIMAGGMAGEITTIGMVITMVIGMDIMLDYITELSIRITSIVWTLIVIITDQEAEETVELLHIILQEEDQVFHNYIMN